MSINREIFNHTKKITRKWRSWIFGISKLIVVGVLGIEYFKNGLNFSSEDFDPDRLVISFVVFLCITGFATFVINVIEDKLGKGLEDSAKKRKAAVGAKNFIEGEWIIFTLVGGKVVEYALCKISYHNYSLQLNGRLFIGDESQIKDIGTFESVVGDYFPSQQQFIYAYERRSDYEAEDEKYSHSGISTGKCKYKFDYDDDFGGLFKITGDYNDPIRDDVMILRGLSVDYLRANDKISKHVDFTLRPEEVSNLIKVYLQLDDFSSDENPVHQNLGSANNP